MKHFGFGLDAVKYKFFFPDTHFTAAAQLPLPDCIHAGL